MRDKYPSEEAERFQIRLPPGLRDRIKAQAAENGRSMNTEIVRMLERSMSGKEGDAACLSFKLNHTEPKY